MNSLCPHCKDGDGEQVERERVESGGLRVTFECENCSERWDVTF